MARAGVLLITGLLVAAPASAQIQTRTRCTLVIDLASGRCASAGVASDQLREALSAGHAQGLPLPGSVSTLGRRFGSTPRVALSARVGFTRFDFSDPERWDGGDPETESVTAPTFSAAVGVGLLDGFSIAPTVGGVLSLDVIADLSTMRLPSGSSFDGASTAFGYGVRVGLLRESFTLPGASISVMRRTGASASVSGTGGSLESEVTTMSIRAGVGKEVLSFGLLGGVGWDHASSDWSATALGTGTDTISVSESGSDDTVFTVFGGITRTFLVTQVGLEAGWTEGLFFGSIGLRLTL